MPRSKKSNGSMKSMGSRVETVSGRTNINFGAGASTINLTPAFFNRCLVMADVFQFFRFTKMRVIVPPTGTTTVVGYAPGALFDTPPTTNAQIIELPQAIWSSGNKTVDTILDVPRSELLKDSQIPWFKTIAGTPAAQFEIQGNLYVFAGANGVALVVEWTCEFQSWNSTTQSPFVLLNKDSKRAGDSEERISDTLVVGGVTYRKSSA